MNDGRLPVAIPDTEFRSIRARPSGKEYRIWVALPADYAESAAKYPVLYLLDPDLAFGDVVESVRFFAVRGKAYNTEVPEMIVVGIGYPNSSAKQLKGIFSELTAARARDFTPTEVRPNPDNPSWPSGGASDFLTFIRDDLKPMIDSDYRADLEDSAIYGASYGGLFALYVLFHKPETFNRYVAISPSLEWDNKVTFEYEREYSREHSELPAKAFFSAGTLEDTAEHLSEFAKILQERSYKDFEYTVHIYEGLSHLAACLEAKTRAILSVFSASAST